MDGSMVKSRDHPPIKAHDIHNHSPPSFSSLEMCKSKDCVEEVKRENIRPRGTPICKQAVEDDAATTSF